MQYPRFPQQGESLEVWRGCFFALHWHTFTARPWRLDADPQRDAVLDGISAAKEEACSVYPDSEHQGRWRVDDRRKRFAGAAERALCQIFGVVRIEGGAPVYATSLRQLRRVHRHTTALDELIDWLAGLTKEQLRKIAPQGLSVQLDDLRSLAIDEKEGARREWSGEAAAADLLYRRAAGETQTLADV